MMGAAIFFHRETRSASRNTEYCDFFADSRSRRESFDVVHQSSLVRLFCSVIDFAMHHRRHTVARSTAGSFSGFYFLWHILVMPRFSCCRDSRGFFEKRFEIAARKAFRDWPTRTRSLTDVLATDSHITDGPHREFRRANGGTRSITDGFRSRPSLELWLIPTFTRGSTLDQREHDDRMDSS